MFLEFLMLHFVIWGYCELCCDLFIANCIRFIMQHNLHCFQIVLSAYSTSYIVERQE